MTPTPTTLVLSEDSKSSKNYLEDAKLSFRAQLKVKVAHAGVTDPIGITKAGIREARRFDKVFCVLDRDEHHGFDDAMRLAAPVENLFVIPSHPCFEYWLLLHFQFSRRPYARAGNKSPADCLLDDLRAIPELRSYSKGSTEGLFAVLAGRMDDATRHAIRSLEQSREDGNPNPSTKLHELIAEIRRLGAVIPA